MVGVAQQANESGGSIKFAAARRIYVPVALLVLAITIAALVFIALDLNSSGVSSLHFYIVGTIAAVLGAVLLLKPVFYLFDVVLDVGPEGIRDRSLSNVLIPWSAVTDISTWSVPDIWAGLMPERKFLIVCLDPIFESKWAPLGTRIRKEMSKHVFGWEGYVIGVGDLIGGSFEDFEFSAVRFWERSRRSGGVPWSNNKGGR